MAWQQSTQGSKTANLQQAAFQPLQQDAFANLQHAPFYKGLLKPFKGKGELDQLAEQCRSLEADLNTLAQERILAQAHRFPFTLMPIRMTHQHTSAGPVFLRWQQSGTRKMNVYFDNSIRLQDGSYEDSGGFWANVELWHRDAESYSRLYQKGMRMLIEGRAVLDSWKDGNGVEQAAMKVQANWIAFLPHRIESITLGQGTGLSQSRPVSNGSAPARAPVPTGDDFDDNIPY